jgi:hypothetical protein
MRPPAPAADLSLREISSMPVRVKDKMVPRYRKGT